MIRPVLLLLSLMLPAAGLAQTAPPRCTAEVEGQLFCMGGTLCACRLERAGQLTGRGEHWAWDCGVLRPPCPPGPAVQDPGGGLPPVDLLLSPRLRRP